MMDDPTSLARIDVRGDAAELGADRVWRSGGNPPLAAYLNIRYRPSGSPAAGPVGRREALDAAAELGGVASFPPSAPAEADDGGDIEY